MNNNEEANYQIFCRMYLVVSKVLPWPPTERSGRCGHRRPLVSGRVRLSLLQFKAGYCEISGLSNAQMQAAAGLSIYTYEEECRVPPQVLLRCGPLRATVGGYGPGGRFKLQRQNWD
jgi:hypothetical protein